MSCAGNSKSKRMQQNRFFDDPANFEKECLDQGADTQKNQISGMNEFLENSLLMILPILKKNRWSNG